MVHASCKKFLLAALLAAIPFLGHAQFASIGSERGSLQWQAVTTPDYKVIYPAGLDSLGALYGHELQVTRPLVGLSAGFLPNQAYRLPMPVILHPFTGDSNGMVVWAPRRMELFTLPGNFVPLPWEKLLSIHENRHVAQMQVGRSGFWQGFFYPFGDVAASVINSLYTNAALLEGDAVVAETALTHSGRGRTANFLAYFRMAFDQGDWRDWYRWRYGSMKYYTPDYYRVGYMTVAGVRYLYDAPLFMSDYLHQIRRPWSFAARQKAVRNASGKKFDAAWKEIAETFHAVWAADDARRGPFQELVAATDVPAVYTAFSGAVEVKGGRVWAIRAAMDRPAEIVELTPEGTLIPIRPFGGNSKLAAAPDGGSVYWSEPVPSIRWDMEQEVRIVRMQASEKASPHAITSKGRLFNPAVSPDGLTLVAIDYPVKGGSAIVLLDAFTGKETRRIVAPDGLLFTEAGFLGKDIVVSGSDDRGNGLYLISGKQLTTLLEPRPVMIQDLRTYGNTAYFTCDRTGTDEIYAYCSDDKSLTRLTNTRYGVNDPFLVDGSLAFSGLTPSGKLLMRSEERFRESVDFSKVASYPIADKLSAQERDLIANMEPATVPEVRPASFHVAENLLHVHSWLPFYYNYDGFSATETDFLYETSSLGAMGFFQSLTGTSGGLLGISFHQDPFEPDRLRAGLHARYRYSGWFPVLSFSLDAGDRSSAFLHYVYNEEKEDDEIQAVKGLSGFYLGGEATASVPMDFSSFGWTRRITPALTLGASTDVNEYDDGQTLLEFDRVWMEASLQGLAQSGIAPSQVIPRWGIGAEGKIRLATDARVLYGRGWLYLPGLTRTQGVKATAALQIRELTAKNVMYPFDYGAEDLAPRGYGKTAVPALLSRIGHITAYGGLEYVMPLLAIDRHVTPYVYMRNLEVVPFFDATAFLSEMSLGIRRRNQILYSLGADVSMRFEKFLMVSVPFKLGLRMAWNGGFCYDWFKEAAGLKSPVTVQAIVNVDL